jgi:RNA polymerase sigma factor (TIGR02999 family)
VIADPRKEWSLAVMDGRPLENLEPAEDLSAEGLLPLVYDELRRVAASRMFHEPAGLTLQPTALVHEAWVRVGLKHANRWESREHFFNAIALTMRRLLIERARRKASLKRGGGRADGDPEPTGLDTEETDSRLLLMDEVVQHLDLEDPEGARIVSYKLFAGLTNAETAEILGVNVRTIERKWVLLKIRLFQLSQEIHGSVVSRA